MVKMLLTNCYFTIRLWIYLCSVFLVAAESLIKTNEENPFVTKPHETIVEGDVSVSHTAGTKPYDAPFVLETLDPKTSTVDEQGFPSNSVFSFSTSEDSTIIPTLNTNPQEISTLPTFPQVLFALTRRSAFEGFSYLLRSLDYYNIPPVLLNVQSTVMRLIRLNFLRVREILDYLQRYSHLRETDLAVMGLILLAETLPRNCDLRSDIDELTSAVVLLKLLEQTPLEMQQTPKCVNKIVQVANPAICNCKLGSESTNDYRPTERTETSSVLVSVEQQEQAHVKVIKDTLLKTLKIPVITEMQHAYELTKSFIENSENHELLKSLTLNDTASNHQQLLLQFHSIVKQHTTISIETKEEILSYIDYVLGRYIPVTPTPEIRFDYSALLEILPNPADTIEEQYLTSLTTALKSEEAYALLQHLGLESLSDEKKQLIEVLKVLQVKYSTTEIREAAKYYFEYLEKLESLTLIGMKKIEKRFDLTGIFSDTLQLGSLPSSAKLGFKKIYKYIANMHGNEMENFNEWNEASTRAQFIQYLFNYFLAQDFVPDDVKTAITTLIPHIQKDGKGALPP